MVVDGCWGSLIHIGHDLMPSGRLGWLNNVILTPSHHRVHHARNPVYIDKNYCNLLPIWDRVFGTYQAELPSVKPEYGITRNVKENSFIDAYFGEFALLFKDVRNAPSWRARLLYVFMPPGWDPKPKSADKTPDAGNLAA
jgi:sterol desaturase/sphingolipid hydroxylase (fatty acid hydroxylase superfamily)